MCYPKNHLQYHIHGSGLGVLHICHSIGQQALPTARWPLPSATRVRMGQLPAPRRWVDARKVIGVPEELVEHRLKLVLLLLRD